MPADQPTVRERSERFLARAMKHGPFPPEVQALRRRALLLHQLRDFALVAMAGFGMWAIFSLAWTATQWVGWYGAAFDAAAAIACIAVYVWAEQLRAEAYAALWRAVPRPTLP